MRYVDKCVLFVFRAWFSICWPEPAGSALEMFLGLRRTLATGSKKDWTEAMVLEMLELMRTFESWSVRLRRGHFLMLDHQPSQLKTYSAIVNGGGY